MTLKGRSLSSCAIRQSTFRDSSRYYRSERGVGSGLARWTLALMVVTRHPAFAQSGPFIDASADFSPVTIGAAETTWHVARVMGGIQQDGAYGVNGTIERQQRGALHDLAIQAGAFRRGHGWTVAGSAAG